MDAIEFRQQIKLIEKTLRERRVTLSRFYAEAKIAHTTWRRWADGETSPNFSTWQRVKAAVDTLCPAFASEYPRAVAPSPSTPGGWDVAS